MYASHFSIDNIPYGIACSKEHPEKTLATRFEDNVIFLDQLKAHYDPLSLSKKTILSFSQPTVNDFAASAKSEQAATRKWIQSILSKGLENVAQSCYCALSSAELYLPLSIGDFTDFSCSVDHLLNAGEAVLGKRELPPGSEHFPIGYHGRTSSIVVSGTSVTRPKGQYHGPDGKVVFGETKRLDYELEVAAVIGKPSKIGDPISICDADDHIFGLVLLNDWSARDIQGLEMNPLGPLNGKSFATSISPWIITLEALEPFKAQPPKRNPDVKIAEYLQDPDQKPTYEFDLSAKLMTANDPTKYEICKSSFSSIYWTLRDLVAHQTINGCNLRTGDLLGTGTISGSIPSSHGCLMEVAAKGGVKLMGGSGEVGKRIFLEDGDTVELTAWAGIGVGFGECIGTVKSSR